MPINIGARRFAKAQRRKVAVAQKRKAELEAGTTSGQIRLALTHPIQHCMISEELFDMGMGVLMLSRGPTRYDVIAASFLLDTFALGVKGAFVRPLGDLALTKCLEHEAFKSMAPAEPSLARKLLHDLVAWADALGFAPNRDYAKIEPIFGSVSAAACDVDFQFGRDGKPLLIGDISQFAPLLSRSRIAAD